LVPQLEKESSVVGLVDDGNSVVAEVLEGSVDDRVVSSNKIELKAPVQVHAVAIKEEGEDSPKEVKIHRHDKGEHKNWCCSNKLVHPLISNHCEGTRIVERVVKLVNIPKELRAVANVVVKPLKEIGTNPQNEETEQVVLPGEPTVPTKCV
jgi:hypothetical protein